MTTAHDPVTGDVFLAPLDPVVGSEQGRTRPVIVFQTPDLQQFTTTYLCVPVTKNVSRLGLPGTCMIRKGDGGLTMDSVALAFQMRAIDRSRFKKQLGTVQPATTEAIADAILGALGIRVT